ncbi:MAG: patatin-like phospholipase family protein [Myxococcota bacterium]
MANGDPNSGAAEDAQLRLQRIETRIVEGLFEHPGVLSRTEEHRLRYAVVLAGLETFQPGAARKHGRTKHPEIRIRSRATKRLRNVVLGEIADALFGERKTLRAVEAASAALTRHLPLVEKARSEILDQHADDFSARHLDQEVGTKTLVNVAGGGGGAAWVYLGAWDVLQRAGIVPGYLVGASMGAILGLFRAAARDVDFDAYSRIAKSISTEEIFRYVSLKTRFGFPGMARLYLSGAIGDPLRAMAGRPDDEALRLADLAIPFDAVVAGIRPDALGETPEQYAASHHLHEDQRPAALQMRAQAAVQLVRLMQFVNPRVAKEIVLGADEATRRFDAIDSVGFSAAIPGLLHYDMTRDDPEMDEALQALMEREEVVALVDGGVANNVPTGPAWRQVRNGRIGTRNAYYLAFDSFHPQFSPGHLWMQPLTRVLALQVAPNDRYAHRRIEFSPTLSPIDLIPSSNRLDRAFAWGRGQMAAELPRIQKFFERIRWIAP